MAHCIDHLQHYAREGNEFLARGVAGDESWCHHFEPESKQQSLQWKHPGSPPPKKSKVIHTSTVKVMLTFFFDQDSHLLIRLPAVRDNSALLANLDHPSPSHQVETTKQAHQWGHFAPRQCKASYGQHNHSTPAEIQVGGSRSPSIQSNLSPCDYAIFSPLKKALKGKRFTSDHVQAVRTELVHNAAQRIL